MGACASKPDQEEKDHSHAIDKKIEEDARRFKRECKILLLGMCQEWLHSFGLRWPAARNHSSALHRRPGSGESGKSTIVKQMKIIHQNGYTAEELAQYRMVVYKNLIDSAQSLVLAMRRFALDPEEASNRVNAERIFEFRLDTDPHARIPDEIRQSIGSLWKDPIMPSILDRRAEFYLMDSAP